MQDTTKSGAHILRVERIELYFLFAQTFPPLFIARVPTVFIKNGFRFFFYSNEHRPIHVHVRKGGGEAVFEVENQILLRESVSLKTGELRDAEDLAAEHRQLIITMWHEHIDR